jgi:hypothetical protein
MREAEPRRGSEGAHGGSEGRGGALVAAARRARFRRGAGRSFECHLIFAFDLFELDEERHANHARGDKPAASDYQLT